VTKEALSLQDSLALAESLLSLSDSLRGAELATFSGIICNTARRLCPDGQFPTAPQELQLFRTALRVLGKIQHHPQMTPNGVLYRGRPDFVTDELLAALDEEARTEVRPRAIWQPGHKLGVGGPLGDELANGEALRALVEQCAGPVEATGVASYLFYEEEGAGITAHVDTDIFSINVNLMLRHEDTGTCSSRLFLFHTDGKTREEIVLEPGDMIISFGDSVLHGRSPLAQGERITNLTIGFQPATWTD
jgi:hypothetical protein